MAYAWFKTKYEGVRYREHPSRKYGTHKDRYYVVRYRVDGQRKEEAIGWESQNDHRDKDGARVSMLEVARATLARLKESHRTGEGAPTLAEQRAQAAHAKVVEEARAIEEEKANRTLQDAFDAYIKWAKGEKDDWDHDETRMTLHVLPHLGSKRLSEIGAADIEMIKVKCFEKDHAPATVKHVLQCVRAIYNFSIRLGDYVGENPTRNVKFPRLDNARKRFFSDDQVDALLSALAEKNMNVYDMTLLSILTGMRFGEIAKLRWQRVDLENELIHVDGKNGETREAYLNNDELVEMFVRRKKLFDSTPYERKSAKSIRDLVFPGPIHGGIMKDIPDIFMKTVDKLGFNEGYDDKRQRLTFHSCRHTFGSRLAKSGVPLLTIKELMGHKTIEMTMRYAHLMPDDKRDAVRHMTARKDGKVIPLHKIVVGE
jgi:integrase